jgi:protein TonB
VCSAALGVCWRTLSNDAALEICGLRPICIWNHKGETAMTVFDSYLPQHAHSTPDPDVPPPPPEKDPPPDNMPVPEQAPIEEPTPKAPPIKA